MVGIRRLAILAAFGGVALASLPALATTANALHAVSVRSGPAGSYNVVAQLQQGDAVDISKCQGSFCYVTFGNGKAGWVSATFLTRDPVKKAPSTLMQTGPVIASAKPNLPQGNFPPAYNGRAATYDNGFPAAGQGNAGYADTGYAPPYTGQSQNNGSVVTLPPDAGDTVASTDAPRPQVDIPDPYGAAGDDATADAGGDQAPDDGTLNAPTPLPDWNGGPGIRLHQGFGPRPRLAALDRPGMAQACFFGNADDDQAGFCLGAGQSVSDAGNWPNRIYSIRNPRGLKVTICGVGDAHACRIYESSGPVMMPDNAAIASISVDPPDGY